MMIWNLVNPSTSGCMTALFAETFSCFLHLLVPKTESLNEALNRNQGKNGSLPSMMTQARL